MICSIVAVDVAVDVAGKQNECGLASCKTCKTPGIHDHTMRLGTDSCFMGEDSLFYGFCYLLCPFVLFQRRQELSDELYHVGLTYSSSV
jgi:hypothetical protein